ncbi:hypothetical protein BDY24DRAFT_375316, partial [Mrakia frigida]|uniref:uncharacterized protein n=1 Tax=Mrakia frigida TaxID=29902 RepID=UPI003FCC2189
MFHPNVFHAASRSRLSPYSVLTPCLPALFSLSYVYHNPLFTSFFSILDDFL